MTICWPNSSSDLRCASSSSFSSLFDRRTVCEKNRIVCGAYALAALTPGALAANGAMRAAVGAAFEAEMADLRTAERRECLGLVNCAPWEQHGT